MVWGLFPAHPNSNSGEKYYIYTKGTYKVGRKGCDVNISNDKGVSRIHAEIIVDAMESLGYVENGSSSFSSKVRIRDCSKYGTYYERNSSVKERVHDCPGNETYLKDGDLVMFGTGNATYRFSYVPLIFYLCNFTSSQGTHSTQDKVSSIGAAVAHKWTRECTHVIVDPFMPVTEEIIDIILSKKHLVLGTWLECYTAYTVIASHLQFAYKLLAASRINNEIPSYNKYLPTLTLDGGSVTVADSKTRDNCLKGYTFMLCPANKYRFQGKVQSLLEVAGAEVLSVDDFDSKSQGQMEKVNFLVLVIPADLTEQFCQNSSLYKVNEINLISAVISGYLDRSILILPSGGLACRNISTLWFYWVFESLVVVSSSCSTDETVVADSDAETETATSDHSLRTNVVVGHTSDDGERQTFKKQPGSQSEEALGADFIVLNNPEIIRGKKASECKEEEKTSNNPEIIRGKKAGECKIKEEETVNQDALSLGDGKIESFLEPNREVAVARNNNLESLNQDIRYSQNLTVRSTINTRDSTGSAAECGFINFKCFRKTKTQSGNSFGNLVPFSRYPYNDSNHDNEISEYVKEEKKRKQMEVMAEDLFNNERGRRRGVAGSLQQLLGRR